MARPAGRWLAPLCLVLLLLVTACKGGETNTSESDAAGSSPRDLTVTTNLVGEEPFAIHDLVKVGDSLVALATSQGGPGATVLRSDDGGQTWSQFATPLADAISGPCPPIDGVCGFTSCALIGPGCDLMAAGPWLVAVRSSGYINHSEALDQQAVFVSADVGTTWELVDLPIPAGSQPFVWTAAEVDGRLILGGTTLPFFTSDDRLRPVNVLPPPIPDAALWESADPLSGFERLAEQEFDGVPGSQRISRLVSFDGRLIAIGAESPSDFSGCCLEVQTTAHESSDGGGSWSPMSGLPESPFEFIDDRPVVVGANLVLRSYPDQVVLEPGSSRWEVRLTPEGISEPFNEVALGDGSTAVTWTVTSACDCSIGNVGRVEDGELVSESELRFDFCPGDELTRPDTSVAAPGLIANQVVALANCSGEAALAYSRDGGQNWATQPLTDSSGNGGLLVEVYRIFPEDGVLIALMSVLGTEQTGNESDSLSQIVAVRVA